MRSERSQQKARARKDPPPLPPPAEESPRDEQTTRPRRKAAALKDPPPPPPPPTPPSEELPRDDQNTTFANDPVRGQPLKLLKTDIADLNADDKYLQTTLIDYLIQKAIPKDIPDDLIIGSSNSLSFFEVMNKKTITSDKAGDVRAAQLLRRKYQFYSLRRHHFISVNCTTNHFIVISVVFDMEKDDPFDDVRVYDSLRKSSRNGSTSKRREDLRHINFLRELQLFLAHFCCFGTKHAQLFLKEPDFLLDKCIHDRCPQQQNGIDCGLFGLATLLHIVDNYPNNKIEDAFNQRQISDLRKGLHARLSKGKDINWEFFCAYLPNLRRRGPMITETDNFIDGLSSDGSALPMAQSDFSSDETEDEEDPCFVFLNDEDVDEVLEVTEDGDAIAVPVAVAPPELEEQPDTDFQQFFSKKRYETLQELNKDIDDFEEMSGVRLVIRKSEDFARTYKCATHIDCPFKAKFGKRRYQDYIMLKTSYTRAVHSGPKAPTKAKGRSYKKRIKGRVESAVDQVAITKDGQPVARDVQKAAANLNGVDLTYKQSYHVIEDLRRSQWEEDKLSFELVIPYLQKFMHLNPTSTVRYETDPDSTLNRVFVCPGIMKETLRHVRPVMSLDAAHLKSKWKGTLYVASVKTACDEIYPVAVAIMRDNENEAGWTWFLELLHEAIELLVMDHPNGAIRYKYFSFVSDRQKGLIQALSTVFPQNHSYFCAIHIARNTEKLSGKKVARHVYTLSRTFSNLVSAKLMSLIEKLSPRARKYLEEINATQWRSTAWLEDISLPPRYGIVTSNMSESTNAMFEEARNGSWLQTLDIILGQMTERIFTIRTQLKEKEGIVPRVLGRMREYWEKCAGFKVVEVQEKGNEFNIVRQKTSAKDTTKKFTIDTDDNTCICGEWQEHGYPCIDAMAYFRLHEKYSLNHVLAEFVDKKYYYETEKEMLRVNIVPVCMDTITPDGVTMAPRFTSKRGSGRPKKKRIRKRPKWACNAEDSIVRCSRCHARGHNVRTCKAREDGDDGDNEDKKPSAVVQNELDLS